MRMWEEPDGTRWMEEYSLMTDSIRIIAGKGEYVIMREIPALTVAELGEKIYDMIREELKQSLNKLNLLPTVDEPTNLEIASLDLIIDPDDQTRCILIEKGTGIIDRGTMYLDENGEKHIRWDSAHEEIKPL